jgi:hypothetical protein
MRKKTVPRTRKNKASSSGKQKGLIAKDTNRRQSAGTKSALDDRSHRTPDGQLRALPAPTQPNRDTSWHQLLRTDLPARQLHQ